jgi:hypothetical protein
MDIHEVVVTPELGEDLQTVKWLDCLECAYKAVIEGDNLVRLQAGDPTAGHLASW